MPVGNRSSDYLDDQMDEALTYCNRCPVKDDCLRWALESGEAWGIWGGVRLEDVPLQKRRHWRDQLRVAEGRRAS